MSKGVYWRLEWVNHVFPLLLGHAHWPVDPSQWHRTSTPFLPYREVVCQAPECGSTYSPDSPIRLFPALVRFLTCWLREVMQEHMNTWCRWISTELRSQISSEHLETYADLWFYCTRLSFPINLSNVWLNFSQMNHCHQHQHHLCSISCYPRYYLLFFSLK